MVSLSSLFFAFFERERQRDTPQLIFFFLFFALSLLLFALFANMPFDLIVSETGGEEEGREKEAAKEREREGNRAALFPLPL